jgi:hypothetical protein
MSNTAMPRPPHRKPATIADRVREWFAQFPGQCFCLVCVVRDLGLERTMVARAMKRLGETTLGSQYKAKCSLLGS